MAFGNMHYNRSIFLSNIHHFPCFSTGVRCLPSSETNFLPYVYHYLFLLCTGHITCKLNFEIQ